MPVVRFVSVVILKSQMDDRLARRHLVEPQQRVSHGIRADADEPLVVSLRPHDVRSLFREHVDVLHGESGRTIASEGFHKHQICLWIELHGLVPVPRRAAASEVHFDEPRETIHQLHERTVHLPAEILGIARSGLWREPAADLILKEQHLSDAFDDLLAPAIQSVAEVLEHRAGENLAACDGRLDFRKFLVGWSWQVAAMPGGRLGSQKQADHKDSGRIVDERISHDGCGLFEL